MAVAGPEGCNTTGHHATTLPPGHEAILEMHANSQTNAITYVLVVLLLYAMALVIVMVKYIRTERYEARLSRLYEEFVRRDRFARFSKRRASVQATTIHPSNGLDSCPRSCVVISAHEDDSKV